MFFLVPKIPLKGKKKACHASVWGQKNTPRKSGAAGDVGGDAAAMGLCCAGETLERSMWEDCGTPGDLGSLVGWFEDWPFLLFLL